MNSWIFGFTLALILAIFNLANANDEENMKSWENFKIKNRKMYKLRKDENKRMRNYLKKQAEIDEHNKLYENGIVSYKQDHNKFSDLSQDEKKHYFGAKTQDPIPNSRQKRGFSSQQYYFNSSRPTFRMYSADANLVLPASVDYRKGWFELVRDQGICASCWAFSASTVMSYYQYNKTKISYLFSPQHLVDCGDIWGNHGCNGGSPAFAFEFMQINKQTIESNYPYIGITNKCSTPSNLLFGVTGFVQIIQNQASLEQAVAMLGPVAITIHADYLLSYSKGIWDGSDGAKRCDENLANHAVVIVGYGTDSATQTKFWIIKNSWGFGWGEFGYFRMVRNSTNLCGIYKYAYTLI